MAVAGRAHQAPVDRDAWLSMPAAERRLRRSRSVIYQLALEGKLKVERIAGRFCVETESILSLERCAE